MSRRWLLSLLCLAVLFLSFVQFTRARGELRVDETNSSILLQKDPAEVLLAVENPSTANVTANVQLELLDPRNTPVAKTTDVQSIARGAQKLRLSLPFTFPSSGQAAHQQLLWYRLHYRLTPQDSPAEILADGIISLSEMTPDLFELRVAAAEVVREGNKYRVRIQAVHPLTQRPTANVQVDGEVTIDSDNDNGVKLTNSASTDAQGRAVLDFKFPSRFPKSPHRIWAAGELKVTGKKGAIVAQTTGDVRVDNFARVLISTDKPLYQPGQVMHVRALMFTNSKRAVANYDTFFKISDPEGAVLYRSVVTTSRFGVASTDWAIPENTRLGDYRIWVGIDGGDDETSQDVRISRYELPNFKVNVDLDRKFYLPGQNATVTVKADYLFGQPVTRGNVRVVRESGRRWNFREQKWDVDEEGERTGQTNRDGSFVAQLDLKSDHEDIEDSDYEPFKDVTYAAYFTDPTTNRTEQRRFDVRVTREPIHVYVLENYNWSYNSQLPVKFYVSTFYADGSPARCKVNASFTDEADYDDTHKHVATVTTNRYGLAMINARLPKEFADRSALAVKVAASDSSGRKGTGKEELRFGDEPRLLIETDKTIYRPGEPINVVITGSDDVKTVIVDLAGQGGLIRSERLQLRNGRASIIFPFKPEFKSTLNVVVYPEGTTSRSTVMMRTVLYPYNSELNVNVRSSRDTYRPGEDAELNFSVRSAADRSEESALGVVVMDQAVAERFRTDREFGGRGNGFSDALQDFLGISDRFAGITMRDLQHLDPSRFVSPDLDMVAAVVMRNAIDYFPAFYDDDDFEDDAAAVFVASMKEQLKPLKDALTDNYARTLDYPENEAQLRDSLAQKKIDFNNVRDPWGMPYHAKFYVEKANDTLALWSSGADKRYDTDDDVAVEEMSWPYFRRTGETIDRAVMRHHQQTGRFIRDTATLRDEVSADGLNLDQMHDPWGKPYRLDFEIEESHFVLDIRSGGPDKHFSTDPRHVQDDFVIWKSAIDYFAKPRETINAALTENLNRTKRFPQSNQEFRQALGGLADTLDSLRDPWGQPYYARFGTRTVYSDRVRVENRGAFGTPPQLRTNVTPVTQTLGEVMLRSCGPDKRQDTSDDFVIATFTGIISEQARGERAPAAPVSFTVISGNNGAVAGVVIDMAGAVVPGATVHATRVPTGQIYETSTDDNGKYSLLSLPPGMYELRFAATGFNPAVIDQVLVRAHNITEVNATLEVGAVTETVTVNSGPPAMVETQATATVTSHNSRVIVVTKSGAEQISTPRVRQYFPETLLWQPSLETDKQGRAQLSFKLADNITTWKMIVIGSTTDGRVGAAEKEIKAFQPFFVEHDPPRVLTEGDQISLPVVVRNYLSQPQKVDLEIKPESWFSLLGPAQKQTSVVAGDSARETFDFRVIASVTDGKQRITARGSNDNDAIEKPVTVHPDGEEVSVTAGEVLDSGTPLELEIAQTMLPNSNRGELKIFPNLLTHVVEGVEAIMERPHGCGEQTISSTYPSLLLLRHSKKTGEGFPLSALAHSYLKNGYARLLNYRAENGGFTYWGNGEPDLALTAYALQFLTDAAEVTSVDPDVLKQAREWLVKQQRPDGSYRRAYSSDRETTAADVLLTAYITRVLARTEPEVSASVKRALDFLAGASQRIDEPYLLASYALAATEAKDSDRAKPAIEKLRTLALQEGNTTYWALETNTPFHGWGLAGRVEATALVVQALAENCNSQRSECVDRKLINGGLLFLLKQKDRYGVWQSTQATVNVLDAMLVLFSQNGAANAGMQTEAEVFVNGNRVQTLQVNGRFNNPITLDISQYLKVGKNQIEIKRQRGLPFASVQAVAKYYVPWGERKSDAKPANKPDLRLDVKFDKTDAKINDEITCRVEAERVGFRGYGMLLGEIGIPPGAEVDRSSLQAAVGNYGLQQYDVLPDRVVVYLWPEAGTISFNFKFRLRFGLNAKNAPSTLYDYYNPEAAVVVPPWLFRIQ